MTLHRRSPRPVAGPLEQLSATWAPATLLAEVQQHWPEAVGETIAQAATPVSERAGVVTVACSAAVWAHELDLLGPTLLTSLNACLREPRVTRLRCVVQTA